MQLVQSGEKGAEDLEKINKLLDVVRTSLS